MTKLDTRLAKLERLSGVSEAGFSWPPTLDVRNMTAEQERAAIAEVKAAAASEGKEIKVIVLIDTSDKI